MSDLQLSIVAGLDDLKRSYAVLSDGIAEQEFLRFVTYHEQCRMQWQQAVHEAQKLHAEVEKGHKAISILEGKLRRARDLLDSEKKMRLQTQKEKESLEKQIIMARDLLFNDTHTQTLNNDTLNKLAFLNSTAKNKQHGATHNNRLDRISEDDMNYTETLLSGASLSRSEDDLDVSHTGNSLTFRKHRASLADEAIPKKRRSRKSIDANKSMRIVDLNPNERVVATTTLTLPKDGHGPITARSVIEAVPDDSPPESTVNPNRRITSPRSPSKVLKEIPIPSAPLLETNAWNRDVSPSTINRNLMRYHNFVLKSIIRHENCIVCNKRIRFGKVVHKCRDCRAVSHSDCRNSVPLPCVPISNTPTMKGAVQGSIADYTPFIAPMVPALVVHCVNEVESRGLNEVGIYRVSGSEKEVKALKERFLRGKGAPSLSNIDIHVICGCLKDFLRSLKEPLITQSLWHDFAAAVKNVNGETSKLLIDGVNELPQPNRDTLAYLVMHLQRVAECPEVKMPISNIAMIFAPTVVGYSTIDPDHNCLSETREIVAVMENLLLIPTDFWAQFICVDLGAAAKQPVQQVTTPRSINRVGSTMSYFASPTSNGNERIRKRIQKHFY